jgi:Arc/MetJ family transcription regulator
VTKRLIEIDDQLLERARSAAGAKTMKETVEVALRRMAAEDAVVRHVERLRRSPLDPAAVEQARQTRVPNDG